MKNFNQPKGFNYQVAFTVGFVSVPISVLQATILISSSNLTHVDYIGVANESCAFSPDLLGRHDYQQLLCVDLS